MTCAYCSLTEPHVTRKGYAHAQILFTGRNLNQWIDGNFDEKIQTHVGRWVGVGDGYLLG